MLRHFVAHCRLPSLQKSSDEFAFAAYDHAGKSLEPFPIRNFGLGGEPVGQQAKLINGDLAAFGALQQVGQQGPREALSSNAWHG